MLNEEDSRFADLLVALITFLGVWAFGILLESKRWCFGVFSFRKVARKWSCQPV